MHAASRGVRTVVVCATRGEAGEVEPGVPVPAGGVGELREAELRTAAAALGVAEVEVLGFADSGLDRPRRPLTPWPAHRPTPSIEAVRDAIDRHAPDVVVTLDGSDGHRDHIRVRDAVTGLLAGTETPVYLQCLPRSLMQAWARHHAADEGKAAYTSPARDRHPRRGPDDPRRHLRVRWPAAATAIALAPVAAARRSTDSPTTSSAPGSAAST